MDWKKCVSHPSDNFIMFQRSQCIGFQLHNESKSWQNNNFWGMMNTQLHQNLFKIYLFYAKYTTNTFPY